MAKTPAELLDLTNDAIAALLAAIADGVAEYQLPDGRRVRREDFGTRLDALNRARDTYQRQAARAARGGVRLGHVVRR